MPKVKKLPKWAIKQAGGINKKAWALARRGRGRKARKMSKAKPRRTPRRVSGASRGSEPRNNRKGWGTVFKTGRTVDIFTGPAQGSVAGLGLTQEAAMDAGKRYAGPAVPGGNIDNVKSTAGGIGTGLLRDWIRSKMGVYRGLGRKKILSGVMAANPEILAASEFNPAEDVRSWNNARVAYDRAYRPNQHDWDISPTAPQNGGRFWQSIGLDVGLKIGQKVAEAYINPLLPPGYNL